MKREILTYSIKFSSHKAFVRSFQRDILAGGIFVCSDVLPQLGQKVKLKLFLPGIQEPIVLYGTVVRVVNENTAKLTGEKVGFGVQLENISEELKNELLRICKGYLKGKLKIHGRRRSPRKKVSIPVDVIYKERTFSGRIVEISLYGAYIVLKGVLIEEEEEITIIFKGEGFIGEKVKARVVYYFPESKAISYGKDEGVGVEFQDVSESLYLSIYSLFEEKSY